MKFCLKCRPKTKNRSDFPTIVSSVILNCIPLHFAASVFTSFSSLCFEDPNPAAFSSHRSNANDATQESRSLGNLATSNGATCYSLFPFFLSRLAATPFDLQTSTVSPFGAGGEEAKREPGCCAVARWQAKSPGGAGARAPTPGIPREPTTLPVREGSTCSELRWARQRCQFQRPAQLFPLHTASLSNNLDRQSPV